MLNGDAQKEGGMIMPRYVLARTDAEIDALDVSCAGDGSRFRGMTYEEGIRAAIEWLFDREADHPMEEE